jgi:predicted nucleic acid-binding protein
LPFWDSSAVVPLIFREQTSESLNDLLTGDLEMVVWGTWTECAVTISRLGRTSMLSGECEQEARAALDGLAADWTEIEPADDLRSLASPLSEEYPLRAADALRWCEGDTTGTRFVCLDNRLRRAAQGEGFQVLPVEDE